MSCRRRIIDENLEFLKVTFDWTDNAEESFSRTCRVCSRPVPSAVDDLLQHATTRACLLQRAEVLRGSRSAQAAASASVATDAIQEYLGRQYRDDDAALTSSRSVAAAPASDKRVAAAAKTMTACRRCSALVSKGDSQALFSHLAGCVGIVTVVNDVAEVP
jgi:hypothetical protein